LTNIRITEQVKGTTSPLGTEPVTYCPEQVCVMVEERAAAAVGAVCHVEPKAGFGSRPDHAPTDADGLVELNLLFTS
jgi:hypothetical protein